MSSPQTSQQLASGSRPRADALVLFGATGDLAYKKLFPSLYHLSGRRVLDGLPIVGVAGSDLSDDDIGRRARDSVAAAGLDKVDDGALDGLTANLGYVSGNYRDPKTFERLAGRLAGAEHP
ncbi:MAG TPA: glucose-6-phosphate dehydrogenase, partial [Acidimicrobiia bacterium]